MTHKGYPDSTGVDYVYDLVGKIQQVTDPTGVYGFAYDNMGRLIGTSTDYAFDSAGAYTNSYSYDTASNRTGLTAPDGSTNTYGYDTLNRLSSVTNSLTGAFGFSYDALSRRTQLTRPNGVNTNYFYDSLSRLLSVLHQAGSTTLDGASYVYDNAGNRTSKTNYLNSITEGYTYDPLYQLTQVTQGASTTETYSYDDVGNRLSSLGVPTYSYNASNELTVEFWRELYIRRKRQYPLRLFRQTVHLGLREPANTGSESGCGHNDLPLRSLRQAHPEIRPARNN